MTDLDANSGELKTTQGVKTSSFAGDVLKLASGATVAQVLAILVAPVLSRLFAPQAFGTAAVFSSILSVIALLVCLRYELAIMLPKKDSEAANLLVASLFFVGLFTALTALGVLFLQDRLLRWLNAPDLEPFLWLLPLAVLSNGGYLALRYWHTRTKRFGLLSGVRMTASGSTVTVKLGGGLFGFASAGALIGGNLLGATLSLLSLGAHSWRNDRTVLLQVRWSAIKSGLKRYAKFPLVNSWSVLFNHLSRQVPILFLSRMYSQTTVGFYSFGMRMIQLPMLLIGGAIGQVFFQRAAATQAMAGDLRILVERTVERLLFLVTLPIVLLVLIGPDIFAVVFGAKWAEAGVYARILAPSLLLAFSIGSLPLFSILERQEAGLIFTFVLLIGRLAPFVLGQENDVGPRRVLLLFSAFSTLAWLCVSFWQYHNLNIPRRRVIVAIGRPVIYTLPTAVIVAAAKWGLGLPSVWVLVVAVVASSLYLGLVLRHDDRIRETFTAGLRRVPFFTS